MRGGRKNWQFLTSKSTYLRNDAQKSRERFRLTPKSTTLDDL